LQFAQLENALHSGLGGALDYISELDPDRQNMEFDGLLSGTKKMAQVLTGNQLDLLNVLLAKVEPPGSIVVLKGCAMALLYYPDSILRVMGDVDLLVTPEQQRPVEDICASLGFVKKSIYSEEFYLNFHHSMPLFNSVTKVWAEIHTRLFDTTTPLANDQAFQIEMVREQVTQHQWNGLRFGSLNKEMLLIYTCAHWADECNWEKSAIRLLDMLLIIHDKRASVDWKNVINISRSSPASSTCLILALSFFNKHGLASVHQDVLMEIAENEKKLNPVSVLILHWLIFQYSMEGKQFGRIASESNIAIVWSTLMFGSLSSWGNLLFLLPKNILFPPKSANRFSLHFQFSRIKKFFKSG
jgi:hypothetical protein